VIEKQEKINYNKINSYFSYILPQIICLGASLATCDDNILPRWPGDLT
jgi:hypothetical protein